MPAYEVLVPLTELAAVEDGVDRGRRRVVSNVKGNRGRVRVRRGRAMMRFKQRDMEDGMEARKMRGKTELVGGVGDSEVDGEGTEPAVVELVGRSRRLDVPT